MFPYSSVFTGTEVNYFFVCRRKLWLFSHDLDFEADSDLVMLGKLLHETRFTRKSKEVNIGRIKVDFLEDGGVVHEIKRSRHIEKAHVFQLLYYIYYLKKLGATVEGVLHYPLLKRTVEVKFTNEREKEVEGILKEMHKVVSKDNPPIVERKSYCKKCSYYDLCWC